MKVEMKKLLARPLAVLFLVMVHLGSALCQAPALARFPYSVTIKSDVQTVKSGSKVVIDVAFTNVTDSTVLRPPIEVESMRFAVDVLQAGGRKAAPTDRGTEWHHLGGWSGSGPVFPMEPGTTVHRRIVVSDLYDMTSTGKILDSTSPRRSFVKCNFFGSYPVVDGCPSSRLLFAQMTRNTLRNA
jgi:hypothetical protein